MDNYEYDRDGNRVYRTKTTDTTTVTDTSGKVAGATAAGAGMGMGVMALIVVIVLAVGGWFWFNGKADTPRSVSNDISTGAGVAVGKAKDAVAEVPQAAKDATTPGDQKTTRPNSDGSTGQLDQKK